MKLINKLMIELLQPLQVPVSFQKYTGKALTYITFHEYHQTGEEFAEDAEAFTGHYLQVDIWSKTDYTALAIEVKSLLIAAGFKRLDEADLYEPDTGLYHKGLRFFYLEAREVD
ncbi:MAG: hypothetical protein PHF24_05065 [Syntrophomonas sp.]|nr:hypothetical protein [Syntrophomonas sp.]